MLHDSPLTKAPFIGRTGCRVGSKWASFWSHKGAKGKLISLFIGFFVLEGSQCVRDMQVDGGPPVDICLLFTVKGGPLSMMTTFLCFWWFYFVTRYRPSGCGFGLFYRQVSHVLFAHSRRLGADRFSSVGHVEAKERPFDGRHS